MQSVSLEEQNWLPLLNLRQDEIMWISSLLTQAPWLISSMPILLPREIGTPEMDDRSHLTVRRSAASKEKVLFSQDKALKYY